VETSVDADGVTGAVAEVELVGDLPIDQVWGLVTDVSRIGEWSPECVFAAWQPAQGEVPRVGARFDARNEYAGGFKAVVECVVTEAVRPSVFEWVVLDDDQDVARPGSIWRYELECDDQGRGTRVRHRFTHGPGLTGLREFVQNHPDRARVALDSRLAELRRNMTATLQAMMDARRTER
jgi:uncharacterized protein YndB with AHSA1/START domain